LQVQDTAGSPTSAALSMATCKYSTTKAAIAQEREAIFFFGAFSHKNAPEEKKVFTNVKNVL